MQHKALLAAVFCGALCLTGCIKNIESESVKEMRKAKTQEVISVAKLNEAQAAAITAQAQSEALIAAAQAELIKSQASIAEAEAKIKEAQAELMAIEAQIAKVQLEEEKENLKLKKAEVQKLIAEYEAAIARAEVAKQEALNDLANAQAQAEIDAIKNRIDLLEQEKMIADAAAALQDELRNRLDEVWRKYHNTLTELYDTQAKFIQAQVELAQLEAGMESFHEWQAGRIEEKQHEIALLEVQLKNLESYAAVSSVQLEEVLEPIRQDLIKAKNDELAAQTVLDYAKNSFKQLNQIVNNPKKGDPRLAYVQDWDMFADLAFEAAQEFNLPIQEKFYDQYGRSFAGVVVGGEFIPLFTGTADDYGLYPDVTNRFKESIPVVYPAPEDGVYAPYTANLKERAFIPAIINTPEFKDFLEYVNEVVDIETEAEVAQYQRWAASRDKDDEAYIKSIEASLEGYSEYIEKAEPEITAAEAARSIAYDAYVEAYYDVREASDAITAYFNSQTTPATPEMQDEWDAFRNLANSLLTYSDAEKTVGKAEELVESTKAVLAVLKETEFETKLDATKKKVHVDTLQPKIDPAVDGSLGNILKKATDAVDAKQKEIDAQEVVIENKLDEYRNAELKYAATQDPKDEKAMNEAKKAWEDAKKALETLQEELTPLLEDQAEASKNYTPVYAEYLLGSDAYEQADREAKRLEKQVYDTKNELQQAENNLTDAVTNCKKAEADYKTDLAAFEDAHAKNLDGGAEEYEALYVAYASAYKAQNDAWNEFIEADNEYSNLKDNVYPNYDYYLMQLDPNQPGSAAARWEMALNDRQANAKHYEDQIAEVYRIAREVREGIAKMEAKLDEYDASFETYLAYGAELESLWKSRNEAKKAQIDAKNAVVEAQGTYDAIVSIAYGAIYTDENGNEYTVAGLENLIDAKKYEIHLAKIQLENLINEYDTFGLDDYASLRALIDRYEGEIDILSAKLDSYAAELEILLSELEGDEEAEID